jgi:signal transduction histidine kinase
MILFGFLAVVTLIMTTGAALLSADAVLFLFILAILNASGFVYFTYWRYREIAKLSSYLRQIRAGDYSLDVRDNKEGELSILKNEIYKMTLMLSERSELLQQDKHYLMNAISDISHQLKTPLTSMTVMVDLLESPDLPSAKRKEFTNHLKLQLERLDFLVATLLKLSKIDAGTVLFKKDDIHVEELIEKALEPLLIPIEIKAVQLEVTGDDKASFIGDLQWTTEALINLIKNNVEHIPEGKKLAIHYGENALYTEIIITDQGPGIAKEDLPHIFKRFYKGKNASAASVGIGLAFAHTIITEQHGFIHVKSELGKGTIFQIKFYKINQPK